MKIDVERVETRKKGWLEALNRRVSWLLNLNRKKYFCDEHADRRNRQSFVSRVFFIFLRALFYQPKTDHKWPKAIQSPGRSIIDDYLIFDFLIDAAKSCFRKINSKNDSFKFSEEKVEHATRNVKSTRRRSLIVKNVANAQKRVSFKSTPETISWFRKIKFKKLQKACFFSESKRITFWSIRFVESQNEPQRKLDLVAKKLPRKSKKQLSKAGKSQRGARRRANSRKWSTSSISSLFFWTFQTDANVYELSKRIDGNAELAHNGN